LHVVNENALIILRERRGARAGQKEVGGQRAAGAPVVKLGVNTYIKHVFLLIFIFC
jgi:hypothetical protein